VSRYPPRELVLSWAGLLALLGLTVVVAYQPLGTFNTVVALGIATVKALLIGAVFMELRERNGLMLAFAGAGFFWLAVMLWLAFSDYSTRPNLPPAQIRLGSGPPSRRPPYQNVIGIKSELNGSGVISKMTRSLQTAAALRRGRAGADGVDELWPRCGRKPHHFVDFSNGQRHSSPDSTAPSHSGN